MSKDIVKSTTKQLLRKPSSTSSTVTAGTRQRKQYNRPCWSPMTQVDQNKEQLRPSAELCLRRNRAMTHRKTPVGDSNCAVELTLQSGGEESRERRHKQGPLCLRSSWQIAPVRRDVWSCDNEEVV